MVDEINKNLDEFYMRRALSLAERGTGWTSPNPLVGCVIVKNGEIIGEGWHEKFGEAHAEINALNDALKRGKKVEGATVYVSLEPCCHYGKTPPCAQRLVSEKVSRVVAAMSDPNPKVNSGGLKILREAGIDVKVGCLEDEAEFINRGFIKAQKFKLPWVSLKAASGLDGRMALLNGESKWITGIEARTEAHAMRAAHDAVLVGIETVLHDDPELTVRLVDGRSPLKIILDTHLRMPLSSKIIKSLVKESKENIKENKKNKETEHGRCVIFYADKSDEAKIRAEKLINAGAEVIYAGFENENENNENNENNGINKNDKLDLRKVLKVLLDKKGVLKLMVEGGANVLTSFIREKLADSLSLFVAPKIMGEGIGIGTGFFINSMSDAVELKNINVQQLGRDILIEGLF